MAWPCGRHGFRIRGFFLEKRMNHERIVCFVDGFNLYHALNNLRQPHLKWLDLQLLFKRLSRSKSQIVTQILFFSAYPTWKLDSFLRHKLYVKALTSHGVTPVLGQFKNKPKKCFNCQVEWISHEEKETDVNLALAMLDMAYKDCYDHAFLLSRDSDLAPAVRKVKENFPHKKITIFAPYNYRHSSELIQACDGHKTINLEHISTSLFPDKVYDTSGNLVAIRPVEYSPPDTPVKKMEKRADLEQIIAKK
jgi:uncharacterized LabA/DUF88 family protein